MAEFEPLDGSLAHSELLSDPCLCDTDGLTPGTTGTQSLTALEEDFFGEDIWFDISAATGPDMVVTPAGDWKPVTGREALRQSLLRRYLTNPGEWATLPDYGAGLRAFIKAKNTKANRDKIIANLKTQTLADDRVARVSTVTVERTEDVTKFSVTIYPKGNLETAKPLTVAGQLRP